MAEAILNLLGRISIELFGGILAAMVAGYFFGGRGSALWRKLIAYIGNVSVDIGPRDGRHGNKTIGA
jgi:hypothetical protein